MSAPEPIEPVEPVEPLPRPAGPGSGGFFWRDPNTHFLLLAAVGRGAGALGRSSSGSRPSRLTQMLLEATDIVDGPPRPFPPRSGVRAGRRRLVGGLLLVRLVNEKGTHGISQMIDVAALWARRPG